MAPRKRDTQVQEDGQTVYKPAKKAKTVVKEEPEDKKPVRLKPARTKTGRLKPEAEKEEKKPDKKPPRRYEPEQKLTGREKKEKARAAAVARDRRRAVSRAGDGCVTMIALLTAVFEVLGLLLCAAKAEGAWDTQAVRLCMVMAPLGLLTTLALPRLLPMDSLVMALTNFLCGVGVVVLYTVSPERGARQAMFYAMGLAAMLVMSEIVFHVRHFRGLTLLGMALGIGALFPNITRRSLSSDAETGTLGLMGNGAKNWVSVPLLGSFQPSEIVKLSVVLALAYFFSAHRTVWQMMPALLFAAACLLLLMMQRDLGTALIYYLTTLVLFYVACGNVPLTILGLGGGAERTGARVVEVGDVVDLAPAAARRVHAAALGAGEGAQHAVVLVGQGKPQVDAGIDGRTVGGEGYRLGVGRVVTLLLRNRFHAETVGRIGRKARQFNGRPDRHGGPAGSRIIPFVKLVGVFRRPGDRRPGERGRIVRLLDEPRRGSAEHVARENHEIGELRVLPFGGTERSRGKHSETIGNTRLHFETLRPEARRGRLQGRRGVAGIEFEGEAHGLDRLGDAPAHGGRLVRNRDGDIGHGKNFHVGSRRRGVLAATDGKGQHRGQQ